MKKITMLEKIKTLLDSGCYVEVELKKTVAGKIKKGDVNILYLIAYGKIWKKW